MNKFKLGDRVALDGCNKPVYIVRELETTTRVTAGGVYVYNFYDLDQVGGGSIRLKVEESRLALEPKLEITYQECDTIGLVVAEEPDDRIRFTIYSHTTPKSAFLRSSDALDLGKKLVEKLSE